LGNFNFAAGVTMAGLLIAIPVLAGGLLAGTVLQSSMLVLELSLFARVIIECALMGTGCWIAKNARPRSLSDSLAAYVPSGIMFMAGLCGMGLGALRLAFAALVNALWGSQ
jgi:hypothetical protein